MSGGADDAQGRIIAATLRVRFRPPPAEIGKTDAAMQIGLGLLRDPFAAGTLSASPGSAGAIAAGTGSGHGAPGCELSQPTAEFLVGEADRADGIVRQLDACQAIVVQDRQQCAK